MVAHTFNPSTQEAEVGGSLRVWGQPGLQPELQNSQGYMEKPYLKNKQTTPKHPYILHTQSILNINTYIYTTYR